MTRIKKVGYFIKLVKIHIIFTFSPLRNRISLCFFDKELTYMFIVIFVVDCINICKIIKGMCNKVWLVAEVEK